MRFQIAPSVEDSVYSFTWMKDKIIFQGIAGSDAESSDSSKIIKQWTCTKGIPQAGGENARINLWLAGGKPPKDNGKMGLLSANLSSCLKVETRQKIRQKMMIV